MHPFEFLQQLENFIASGKKKKKSLMKLNSHHFCWTFLKQQINELTAPAFRPLSSDLILLIKTNLHHKKHLSHKHNLNYSNSKCELTNSLY